MTMNFKLTDNQKTGLATSLKSLTGYDYGENKNYPCHRS